MAAHGRIDSPEGLGRMLQQGRLLRSLTQRQLAEELGVSQRMIWEMESGKPSLYTDRLFAFMRATGIQLSADLDDASVADRRA